MKRRDFIALLGGATATWPLAAGAQTSPKIPRVGYIAGSGFGRKITALAEPPPRRPYNRLPRCLTAHHPAGTSRMGSDEAVPLDPKLRARGCRRAARRRCLGHARSFVSAHINACVLMMTEKAVGFDPRRRPGPCRCRRPVLMHQIRSLSPSRQRTRVQFVLELERALISRSAGPAEGCSLLQEGECLLNEGGVVLEDAAVPGVREDAQLCIRQPTGELK